MRGSLSSALVLAAGLGWVSAACTAPTFRPLSPRRAESGGQVVEIARADLRRFVIDVDVRGDAGAPRVDGAWVGVVGAADGAPCARRLAALSVEAGAGAGADRTFALRFDRALLDALDGRSDLEVRVAGGQGGARCVSLPLSGPGLDLRWALDPWGENRPYVGHSITLWFPVGSPRYEGGIDLTLVRVGRWWGPARLSAAAGLGLSCCAHDDPDAAFAIPVTAAAEVFPVVAGPVALGLGAAYEVRPSWFSNDGGRGFDLVHGPVGSVEVAYVPHQLRGFLEGPRAGTVGLAFSVGRWLPDGGATVLGASLSIN
jgi:hypothetical protein